MFEHCSSFLIGAHQLTIHILETTPCENFDILLLFSIEVEVEARKDDGYNQLLSIRYDHWWSTI